jgi:NADPH-dependent 2,4-dienoyl-CoA reductase/sulfur reductase-like enzyme
MNEHRRHRIVVLGAGYAGAYAAGNLARRLSPKDVEITVVNAEPDFVQRLRLHQLAAGQEVEAPKLTDVFAGTGIDLRLARVLDLDPVRQVVGVADAEGGEEIGYDTLVYALGSSGGSPTSVSIGCGPPTCARSVRAPGCPNPSSTATRCSVPPRRSSSARWSRWPYSH